ncbi:MAG: superfamily I DNA/RNA helicase [Francisellaceae bacterium]|jgi:superfamily I DNA/RNA helicase
MLKPIVLVGEQRKVLTLNPINPLQIKGVAGSGKTTVAIYRAFHLLDTHTDFFEPSEVAIFTFNKSLSGYLRSLTNHLDNDKNYSSIKIINFHSWAFSFIKQHGLNLYGKTIFDGAAKKIIVNITNKMAKTDENKRILSYIGDFFLDEISWLKGKIISSEQEYLDTPRTGRGVSNRVTASDKKVIWKIFITYKESLLKQDKYDFDDYAILCLKLIENAGKNFKTPFTHIVIDEAQDLNKAQISLLAKLVSKTTKSITIIADAAQRIYKSGFIWKEVGINVTGGRTVEFKRNYRNSKLIAKAAQSLLSHDNDSSDFTAIEVGNEDGEAPFLCAFNSSQDELDFITKQVKRIVGSSPKHSTCVLQRTGYNLKGLLHTLLSEDILCEDISNNKSIDYFNGKVKVCKMHSIKGLEFDHVFIMGLTDDNLPNKMGFSEEEDDLHITTERRLLYTCMTRACKTLTLTYAGEKSRYLNEIDKDFLKSL